MNVYRVISEELNGSYMLSNGLDVPEPYHIAEVVAAETPSKARWLAWKSDPDSKSDMYDIRNMPKFKVELVQRDFPIEAGVLPNEWSEWWIGIKKPYRLPYAALVDAYLGIVYEYEYDDYWAHP